MMTAKEYVADKVKSYTRLARRCREEAETSDDIVVRAEYSARANVWEMCAEEMDNVREILEEESGGDHVCLAQSTRHVVHRVRRQDRWLDRQRYVRDVRPAAWVQKRKQLCIGVQPQPQRQAPGSQVHF